MLSAPWMTAAVGIVPSFGIHNNKFIINGTQPTKLASGSIHYSRVHPGLWDDRLGRMRAMGLNSITTYVPWNFHEAEEGHYDFSSPWRDLARFVRLAGQHGLFVIMRGGPYMCGEWEFGGLPAWLLQNGTIHLRTDAQPYMSRVDRYYTALLTVVKPLLYENGGPVIMFQVENEYGSYGNVADEPSDRRYMVHLIKRARGMLGPRVVLFTTDGASSAYMSRGSINGSSVTTMGDGCSDPAASWEVEKNFNPAGGSPFLCAELYPGWLTHWGEKMANTSSALAATHLDAVLAVNGGWGSASLYMAHGGTSFGWWAGANGNGGSDYHEDITSYDYDAPLSEGGEHGYGSDGLDKFAAIAAVLGKEEHRARMVWYGQAARAPPPPTPAEAPLPPRAGLKALVLTHTAPLLASASVLEPDLADAGRLAPPQGVETVGCYGGGFALFEATAAPDVPLGGRTLTLPDLHDRAIVFAGAHDALIGTICRTNVSAALTLPSSMPTGGPVRVLLELLGRINYSHGMDDSRFGLLGGVQLDGEALPTTSAGWSTRCLNLSEGSLARLRWQPVGVDGTVALPAFFKATFTLGRAGVDTYLSLPGFAKGAAWVNGFALGRYWNDQGPQRTLYVPAPLIKAGENELVILELHTVPSELSIDFVTRAVWTSAAKAG